MAEASLPWLSILGNGGFSSPLGCLAEALCSMGTCRRAWERGYIPALWKKAAFGCYCADHQVLYPGTAITLLRINKQVSCCVVMLDK